MTEPFVMASTTWGAPPTPQCQTPSALQNLTAAGGRRSVSLQLLAPIPEPLTSYRVYYDQAGKLQFRANVPASTTTYIDSGLSRNTRYCYRVTAWSDCNCNGTVVPERKVL